MNIKKILSRNDIPQDVKDFIKNEHETSIEHDLIATILKLLNSRLSFQSIIKKIISKIIKIYQVDAVGIRLKNNEDFPYYYQNGFSDNFIKLENSLLEHDINKDIYRDESGRPKLECTCGLVIEGKTDPANPLCTKGGSIWTNYSPLLLSLKPNADPRHNPRNNCIHNKFNSIALIPIRSNNKIVGLLQLNAYEKGILNIDKIKALENIASVIGSFLLNEQYKNTIKEELIYKEKLIQKLQESEEKFKTVVKNSEAVIFIINKKGYFELSEGKQLKLLGFKPNEVVGKSVFEIYKNYPDIITSIKNALKGKPSHITVLIQDLYFNVSYTPIFKEKNTISKIVGIAIDITKRKNIEDSFKESELKFKSLFDNMSEGFALHSMVFDNCGKPIDYIFLEVNEAFEKQTTLKRENIIGKKVTEILPGIKDDPADWINVYGNLVITGEPIKFEQHSKLMSKWYSVIAYRPNQGQFAVIVQDITDHKKKEEEILKIQNLESLGLLAGGIAHDFNNLLNGIIGNINLAQILIDDKNKVLKKLKESEKILTQTSELTHQLLTFSKGGKPIRQVFNLKELLKETTDFCIRGSDLLVKYNFKKNKFFVNADKGQIRQVIQNIIINSKQASTIYGKIEIKCEDIIYKKITNCKCGFKLNPGNYIRISITDNGSGIPNEKLSKVFDPYFTTKDTGHGLGLAVVFSIIKKHDGCINLESIVGKGTVFEIYLPACEPIDKRVINSNNHKISGKSKILFMDDEEYLCDLFRDGLSVHGFEVKTVSKGEEAVKIFQKNFNGKNKFDLVILDYTIKGGMGGKETIKKLLNIDPQIKSIAFSGFATDPVISNPKKYGFTYSVTKPCSPSELASIIKEI